MQNSSILLNCNKFCDKFLLLYISKINFKGIIMKNRYLLLLGIVTTLLLSGCGNSSSTSTTTDTGTQTDLNESEISIRLSDKTFYYVGGDDDAEKVYTIVFNKDLTSLTSTEDTAPKTTTLKGDRLNLPNNESFTLKEVTADYLVMNYFEDAIFIDTFKLYSDKSKAEAYLASLAKVLSTLIVGTTQYTINTNGVLSDKVLKDDGVFTENVTLPNGTNFDAVGTYSIEDTVLTLTRDTGVVIVATYLEHSSEYITLSASLNEGEAFKTYWFLTAEARDSKGKELIK